LKEWQVSLGGALVMFAAAAGMFLWANSLDIPTTFLEIADYFLVSNRYFVTFLAGVLFTGFGGGLLICTMIIYQLEQKLSQTTKHTKKET
jgi:uncharacterized membrane protein YciS (DUF1049 family)